MSRIGKNPISIPAGIDIKMEERLIKISGKYGNFEHILESEYEIKIEDNKLYLVQINPKKHLKFYGLTRSLLANKIKGASEPFKKVLIAKGVGYKFQVNGEKLILSVGYSHPIEFDIPKTLKVEVEANIKLILSSSDKEELGFFAARVRKVRPPEPYKGKGIMYDNEKIIRKVGKSGKK